MQWMGRRKGRGQNAFQLKLSNRNKNWLEAKALNQKHGGKCHSLFLQHLGRFQLPLLFSFLCSECQLQLWCVIQQGLSSSSNHMQSHNGLTQKTRRPVSEHIFPQLYWLFTLTALNNCNHITSGQNSGSPTCYIIWCLKSFWHSWEHKPTVGQEEGKVLRAWATRLEGSCCWSETTKPLLWT